jgi:PIN domain nuclease of toxin-antitoxin system
MTRVYDASALLAVIFDEPGAEVVMTHLAQEGGAVSAVNWAEVGSKMVERGLQPQALARELASFALEVVPFDAAQALTCAALRLQTKALGLSLADRSCLGLAQARRAKAITADRAWAKLKDFDVALIR